ncbi:Asp/Glu/hydantoin racemase [Enterobacteriales bacterium SAP-6]|uniref:Asp/Glu/hydantoin racemase n=1 Tax=Acerihabitans arboris TaxID=2691583 RepID=A0A845SGH7_9GAMM|nr:Asp/Glu/hydantoin racemase [Acerihabitans arboris]
MDKRIRLGILTPSSNTALEPLTQALVAGLPGVSVHFARFPVTRIALGADALAQFRHGPIIAAARLLADAHVDAIGWSGTSAGWLGFASDETLCREITAATGVPAATSVLALNKALAAFGIRRLALVSPYLPDVQDNIIANYAAAGIALGPESHLSLSENFAFGLVDEATLDRQVAEVATGGAQGIATFCTNLRAAQRVAYWEQRHRLPVFDTVITVVWDMLRRCGVDTRPIAGWGRLFQEA